MIAVDAMGGDYAPTVTVDGAIRAAKRGISIGLFGDEARLILLLQAADPAWRSYPITLIHCSETIAMDEEPSRAVLKKIDASLVRAAHAVADGQATALITAGNSGAALAAGTLIIKRIPAVMRPALGNFIPTPHGSVFCIDLGATTDCKPEYLEQFAHMGSLYVSQIKKIDSPRVGLLSNGAEPYKGSALVKEAYDRLTKSGLNFVGNVEARDIFDDRADVIVTDGFTGNVMLKTIQGTARTLMSWIKQEALALPWYRKIGFSLGKPIFSQLRATLRYQDKPGALLLGIRHPLLVVHGCAEATGIENAILLAHQLVADQFLPWFNEKLSQQLLRPAFIDKPHQDSSLVI